MTDLTFRICKRDCGIQLIKSIAFNLKKRKEKKGSGGEKSCFSCYGKDALGLLCVHSVAVSSGTVSG